MANSVKTEKDKLTPNQRGAVEYCDGPLLIVAGPGAGKTRVLIERIEYMIKKKKINPDEILITTFTVKAAEEVKSRIVKKIGSAAQSMQISTIHSLCQNILESNPEAHDLGGTFDILDEDMQYLFFRVHYYALGLNKIIKHYDLQKIISFFNILTENCITPEILIKKYQERYPEEERYIQICKIYKKYLELLKEEYKIDFPGLQMTVFNLLKNNDKILEGLQKKFKYLLIDEYQDTNAIQAEIFRLIAGKKQNICVVGDEDQSIYGFRGANIDNFRNFAETYKKTKIINLDKNFRSKDQIVSLADKFMKPHRSFEKKLSPVRGKGNEVVLVRGTNAQNEAELVVDSIKKLKENKIIPHYGYVSLLFKSVNYHAKPFINELKEKEVDYEVKGAGGFLEREEIRTMLYLMAYVDPPDYEGRFNNRWDSWWNLSMFKTDVLKLSGETIKSLQELPKDFDISQLFLEKDFNKVNITDEDDIGKLKTLNYLKKELSERDKGVLSVFYEVMKRTKYFSRLFSKADEENKSKLFNLSVLTQLISKYELINRRSSLEDFLWYLYGIPKEIDEKVLENPFAVKIMTVHQAKGLEFPVVFVCSVMKGRFPRRQVKEEMFIPLPEELLLAKPERGLHEERRLFYVGMTRAQDSLIISTADKVNSRGGGISPFIDEEIGLENFQDQKGLINSCKERPPKDPPTNKLSYSSLNTYAECPLRFQLIYSYEFATPAGFMQNYGIIVHNSLHRLHLAMKGEEKIDFDKVKEIVEKSWIKLSNNKKKDDKKKEELQARLFFNYYESMKDHIKEIISTEEPFTLVFDNFIITGRIDLIIKNKDDEIELIDFKAMEEEGLTNTSVEMQLRIYEYALKNKQKINKLCAYTFKDNKKTYFKSNNEVLRDIDSELEDVIDSIKKEKFDAKKNAFCDKCAFKFACKIWEKDK
jgi:DNA helicase II / ATP-dependent DNA helicase PcrA